ncbi:CatB-related O-acetyltransferase [Variovorax sp. 22077]|uniref:CatB-related O-acetyltransferase n=1 Tax=Variovorax sp. 22077 TaxID=3453867 RepID=UPI003F838E1B
MKHQQELTVGASKVSIGRFTYGFENVAIREWGEGASLRIGSFCSLASSITIFLGGNHRTEWISTFPFGHIFADELGGEGIEGHPATRGGVEIGSDVWIGHGVTIMSGVTIGDGAVLAANSNVVRNVGPFEIVGGNPAKLLKTRFTPEIRDALLTLRWWDEPSETIRMMAPHLCAAPDDNQLAELFRLKAEGAKGFARTDSRPFLEASDAQLSAAHSPFGSFAQRVQRAITWRSERE